MLAHEMMRRIEDVLILTFLEAMAMVRAQAGLESGKTGRPRKRVKVREPLEHNAVRPFNLTIFPIRLFASTVPVPEVASKTCL